MNWAAVQLGQQVVVSGGIEDLPLTVGTNATPWTPPGAVLCARGLQRGLPLLGALTPLAVLVFKCVSTAPGK